MRGTICDAGWRITMFRIVKKSVKTGVVTGQYPESTTPSPVVSPETQKTANSFKRSLTIREVATGSCNGCETEMNALANPVYDAERLGIHIAASLRHADSLFLTGPEPRNLEPPPKDRNRSPHD